MALQAKRSSNNERKHYPERCCYVNLFNRKKLCSSSSFIAVDTYDYYFFPFCLL